MYVAICTRGAENIVKKQLISLAKTKFHNIYPGFLVFDFDKPEILDQADTAEDILVVMERFPGIKRYRKSLGFMREQLVKSVWRKAVSGKEYRVFVSYLGRRDYTADEMIQVIRSALGVHISERADRYLRAYLTQEFSFLGLSLWKEPLFVQNKPQSTIKGSIKSSLANAMVFLADILPTHTVVDPMTGAGTIAIAAHRKGCHVIAGDKNEEYVGMAKNNMSDIDFRVWDASDTKLAPDSVDRIVCNLPYGKQVEIDAEDIKSMIKEWKRISRSDATWVLLTNHPDIVRPSLKGCSISETKLSLANLSPSILIIRYRKSDF